MIVVAQTGDVQGIALQPELAKLAAVEDAGPRRWRSRFAAAADMRQFDVVVSGVTTPPRPLNR